MPLPIRTADTQHPPEVQAAFEVGRVTDVAAGRLAVDQESLVGVEDRMERNATILAVDAVRNFASVVVAVRDTRTSLTEAEIEQIVATLEIGER